MATYRNSFHKPGHEVYGPAYFNTDAKPIYHAGCAIYERIKGVCWDVVRDGICIAQRAGMNGARQAAEQSARNKR